jgi:hypothetical protein
MIPEDIRTTMTIRFAAELFTPDPTSELSMAHHHAFLWLFEARPKALSHANKLAHIMPEETAQRIRDDMAAMFDGTHPLKTEKARRAYRRRIALAMGCSFMSDAWKLGGYPDMKRPTRDALLDRVTPADRELPTKEYAEGNALLSRAWAAIGPLRRARLAEQVAAFDSSLEVALDHLDP